MDESKARVIQKAIFSGSYTNRPGVKRQYKECDTIEKVWDLMQIQVIAEENQTKSLIYMTQTKVK